jgi:UDP-N-acetylmuramoylalanine--D-glutamate ligase
MLYGLREYHGEPHRVQSIGLINGIEYFDDSKGTNVGATLAAWPGLGADRRLVVIWAAKARAKTLHRWPCRCALRPRGGADRARCAG